MGLLRLRVRPRNFVEAHVELVELIRRSEVEAARKCHYAEWEQAVEDLLAAITRCGLKCP